MERSVEATVAQLESEISHLKADLQKVMHSVSQLSEVKGDIRSVQDALTHTMGNQRETLKKVEKDLNNLGDKIRAVEALAQTIEKSTTTNSKLLSLGERGWWIIFAAMVGIGASYFKVPL